MYNSKLYFHFVGIGGVGMSSIAEILLGLGFKISGSDLKCGLSCKRLQKLGAVISEGHRAEKSGQSTITRRSFVQTAALFSGGMFGMPLWAAMRYCKDTVLSRFREQAKVIDARVAAGIEQNRKSQASLFFEDA